MRPEASLGHPSDSAPGPVIATGCWHSRENGIAVIVVLWTLLLLAVIATGLSTQARKQGYLARNATALARAEAAADGGVVRGVVALLDPRIEQRWIADGRPHHFMLDGVPVEIAIVDEAGKLDVNTGSPELLASLLEVMGARGEVAFGIASDVAAFRSGGAAGQPSGFETTAELLTIAGMTPALFDRVAPFVTVLTRASGVDPSVAQRPMLVALNGRESPDIDALLAARVAGPDGGAMPNAAGSIVGGPGAGGQVSESQHTIYAITATASAGPALFTRQAIVRLTHSPDLPYLVHSWRRLPSPAPHRQS